jgi:hypothetical protein
MATKYFIVLLADSGVPGHAFVSFGIEDDILQSSITEGTWGMYPKSNTSGVASFLIGEVPGQIKDDYLRNKDYSLIIEVSGSEYNTCKAILTKWRNKNYQLVKSDCLSFVIEIANVIKNKITLIPRAGFDNLPAEYLKSLILANKH